MKRVYIDMDDTIFDFKGAYTQSKIDYPGIDYPQKQLGFFYQLKPIKDAVACIKELTKTHDIWFATRPSVLNLHCYTEKAQSIALHFGLEGVKKLIIIPDKSLLIGDYLIDDSTNAGQQEFKGQFIHFGRDFSYWSDILTYLQNENKITK